MAGLPRPTLFSTAEAMPLVIVSGVAHCLAGIAEAREMCFSSDGLRLRLCPLQSFAEMEQEYMETHAAQIDAFKTSYLRRTVDGRIRASQQVQAQAGDVLAFMVREMIPYLRSLLVGAHQAALEKAQRLSQAWSRALPEPEPPVSPVSAGRPGMLLSEAIGQDALIVDQYLYPLAAATDGYERNAPLVKLNRRRLAPVCSAARALELVEQGYQALLEARLEREAQCETSERQRAMVELESSMRDVCQYVEQHPIPPTADCTLYDDGDYCLMRRNSAWYVCQHLPAYVVEDGDGALYRFDATIVGVPVGGASGGLPNAASILNPRRAEVLTPGYEHMFVPEDGSTICLVKGDEYYQSLRQMPLPPAICELLQASTGVLRLGHNALNGNVPHRRISNFTHRRITREQAEAGPLPISPYRR